VAGIPPPAGGEHARPRLSHVETAFLQRIYVLFFISLATDGLSTSPAPQVPIEHD
jgi:hypothetical protein